MIIWLFELKNKNQNSVSLHYFLLLIISKWEIGKYKFDFFRGYLSAKRASKMLSWDDIFEYYMKRGMIRILERDSRSEEALY